MESIKSDFQKANKIYKTNCDDYNYPRSCQNFAVYSFLGKGQEKPDYEVVSVRKMSLNNSMSFIF